MRHVKIPTLEELDQFIWSRHFEWIAADPILDVDQWRHSAFRSVRPPSSSRMRANEIPKKGRSPQSDERRPEDDESQPFGEAIVHFLNRSPDDARSSLIVVDGHAETAVGIDAACHISECPPHVTGVVQHAP